MQDLIDQLRGAQIERLRTMHDGMEDIVLGLPEEATWVEEMGKRYHDVHLGRRHCTKGQILNALFLELQTMFFFAGYDAALSQVEAYVHRVPKEEQ